MPTESMTEITDSTLNTQSKDSLPINPANAFDASHDGSASPPLPLAKKQQRLKEDLFSRGRHYMDNVKKCSNLEDFMALNQKDFGASLLGVDKFCASTLFGYCSGYAMRSAMKAGALACGVGFISLQALNYYGYIDVKWGKIQKEFENQLDLNKDGKVDAQDIAHLRDATLRMLTWGLPSAAGFGVGFFIGLK